MTLEETKDWMVKDFPVDLRYRIKYEAALKGATISEYVAGIFKEKYKGDTICQPVEKES